MALQAQLELYHHAIAFVRSAALKAAVDLRISDAIHRRGGAATLPEVATETGIQPTKLSHLRRLMRVLVTFGIFSVDQGRHADANDVRYKLTPVSRLLVGDYNQSPIVRLFLDPSYVTALCGIAEWFTDEHASARTLFEVVHGCTRDEMVARMDTRGEYNVGVAADSRLVMEVALKEHRGIFEGVSSLVDAGGAHGAAAEAICKAFPHIKCIVLDLPHAIAGAPAIENVQFAAGDLFEYVPPADVVLLKWVMCLWQDEDAVKVLRRCKDAITTGRSAGGKVIIIDVVIGSGVSRDEVLLREMQVLYDVFMMRVDGTDRDEHQWRKIFFEAGFKDYKITPMLGYRSIIEVYP
uniref:O-methyltransferase ZRP4 n=1 Tax=Aegilops tauschii TaxID=37682 RepID=M8CS64_AEGTA